MPSRLSTRSARPSSAISRKSSVATFNPRASVASRASSVNLDLPVETPDNALRTQVASVFREAQKNAASHRKLVVTLRKIQEACCYEPTGAQKLGASDFEEDDFSSEFARCVLRVLPVKKTETAGDTVIRFIGLFLRHSIEKGQRAARRDRRGC